MIRLAVLGASGHGKVVADTALAAGWKSVVFFDDAWPRVTMVGPWPVVGATADLIAARQEFDGAVIAIGDNRTRLGKQAQLTAGGVPLASILHPTATVSSYATIGEGCVVFAGAVINAFVKLGTGCIVNTSATVDHDCELADGVHVSPGAHLGGAVRVGQASWIGIGAAVRQGVSIGADVIIGAGAAVVTDISDAVIAAGVPARPLAQDSAL